MYLVAYDIRDPRRLKKISNLCLQFSVFEFDLDNTLAASFTREMEALIDPASDRVMVIPVCAACRANIRSMGQAQLHPIPKLFCF